MAARPPGTNLAVRRCGDENAWGGARRGGEGDFGRRNFGSECEGGGEEGTVRKRGCVVEVAVVVEGARNSGEDEGLSSSSWFSVCRFAVRSWGGGDGVGEEERIIVSWSVGSAGLKRRRRLRTGDEEKFWAVDVGFF